eukprot:PITA_02123
MDFFLAELGETLRIINVYGPCQRREDFWQLFLGLNLTNMAQVIIGGDLNYSIGYGESWGSQAQIDPLSDFFKDIMDQHHLADIPMNKPLPTWRNRRVGDAALARRLDRFLIKIPLLQRLTRYRQWVGSWGKFDHSPIFLEILGPDAKPKAPFKFNHVWLQNEGYTKLIKDYWATHPITNHRSVTEDDRNLGFTSHAEKSKLIALELQKDQILKEKEESWRLKSRAIWLKAGDENTKFYQNFAKRRKISNTIWKLPLPDREQADNFRKLSRLGTSHFRSLFRSPLEANLADIIQVAGLFPRMVGEEEEIELSAPATLEELEGVLRWFKKDKSPGPDGWTIEFYLAFFDTMATDLLQVVEECRSSGKLYDAINSTFIALIPKSDSPASFDDFRPISLCNCLYKIISKIIANRIRPILSKHILSEQFAFLEDHQIHEAIDTTQEAIHSIRSHRLKGIILKIDLVKAFDRVNWLYIKMLLIHLGFPLLFTNWIMAIIYTPSYSLLINGFASPFFHVERGLRQGCPLSPLLFLLVMECLSRLIYHEKQNGRLIGINITDQCYLTHLLFMDDVLIFLDGSIRGTNSLDKILAIFYRSTGMVANHTKSSISLAYTTVQESNLAL